VWKAYRGRERIGSFPSLGEAMEACGVVDPPFTRYDDAQWIPPCVEHVGVWWTRDGIHTVTVPEKGK
jgi:hypothetical protein